MAHDPFADFTIPGVKFINPTEEAHKRAVAVTEEAMAGKRQELTDRISAVSRDLQGKSNATPMPLSVFENIFYPMFANELTEEEHRRRMHAWSIKAGSPYAEVPIIDDKTGQHLFNVPSLMVSDIIDNKGSRLQSEGVPPLGRLQEHLTALRNSGRFREAEDLEARELEKRVPDKADSAPYAMMNMLRWNAIAAALNKPPIYAKLAKRVMELDAAANPSTDPIEENTAAPTAPVVVEVDDEDDIF